MDRQSFTTFQFRLGWMDWCIGKGKPAWPVIGKWMQAMSRTKHIRKSVEDELSFDPLADASDISVKTLKDR